MNDRIKLAEAMGSVPSCDWSTFDPFNNANDDYAVLEWMRKEMPHNQWLKVQKHWTPAWLYQIGDYARAALKVIDND